MPLSKLSRLAPGNREYLFQRSQEMRGHLRARFLAPAFAEIGERSRISSAFRLEGAERIKLGTEVRIGPSCWLATYDRGELEIGDYTGLSGGVVITSVAQVHIGRDVGMARNVFISDHTHTPTDDQLPIMVQPLRNIMPVHIGDGVWLGHGVVVLPGVTIGDGAVVGANSVVRSDIPARHLAVGTPARVVKSLEPAAV